MKEKQTISLYFLRYFISFFQWIDYDFAFLFFRYRDFFHKPEEVSFSRNSHVLYRRLYVASTDGLFHQNVERACPVNFTSLSAFGLYLFVVNARFDSAHIFRLVGKTRNYIWNKIKVADRIILTCWPRDILMLLIWTQKINTIIDFWDEAFPL